MWDTASIGLMVVDLCNGSLVLLDQVLNSDEVTTSVIGVDNGLLFSDPSLNLINFIVKVKYFSCLLQAFADEARHVL